MKIKIIGIGHLKDGYLREMEADYLKRLSRYAKVEVVESEDFPNRPGEEEKAMLKEWEKASRLIRPTSFLCALDPRGKELSSHELPDFLEKASIKGKGEIVFLIGGSLGLDEKARQRADYLFSLSKLTLTHGFARALLLEQLYRAFKIRAGEPYDK